jgi:predicted membrane protein
MSTTAPPSQPTVALHLPSLLTALTLMLAGTLYPLLMTDAAGRADHPLALLLFWAMSAGFVRGVGFVPRAVPWRWLLGGWACFLALGLAVLHTGWSLHVG